MGVVVFGGGLLELVFDASRGKKKCFGWGLVEVWELFMTANIIITFFLFNKTSN